MSLTFRGTALPLDNEGLNHVVDILGVKAPELWAVLTVETRGCGFLPDRRPCILFERHIFSRETNHAFDDHNPDISNPRPGGYGASGAHQYNRLEAALVLDRRAALRSTSWGIGQLMGFNAEIAGYPDVDAMVTDMQHSESRQLIGMAGEISYNKLDRALRKHDWTAFARGYNGQAYSRNSYDKKLADAYQKYSSGPLPDLAIRSCQMYLTFLGYPAGPVDGIMGRLTRSALNSFQSEYGLPLNDHVDDDLLVHLANAVSKLSD